MRRNNARIAEEDLLAAICRTCGTQFPPGDRPASCPICEDERQYVGNDGQQWTDLDKMGSNHHNKVRELEPGLIGIGTLPRFAIGQRALLIQTDQGNLLWDCVSYIDEETIQTVADMGGVDSIAVSHPHYYSSMVTWSRAFGGAPIHLHASSQRWVERDDPAICYWNGDVKHLFGGLSLHNTGGHFEGYQVLHWPGGADEAGALLSGDQPTVCADRRWVSFMYSYPNYIPLSAPAVTRITKALEHLTFDRIYGAWWEAVVQSKAKEAVRRSAARYIQAISG